MTAYAAIAEAAIADYPRFLGAQVFEPAIVMSLQAPADLGAGGAVTDDGPAAFAIQALGSNGAGGARLLASTIEIGLAAAADDGGGGGGPHDFDTAYFEVGTAIAEAGITEPGPQAGFAIALPLMLAASLDEPRGGAGVQSGSNVLELSAHPSSGSGGFAVHEQLIWLELVPPIESAAGGAGINDAGYELHETGVAIAEAALTEPGRLFSFAVPMQFLLLATADSSAGGANTRTDGTEIVLASGADEAIARSRNLKKLAIAS